MTTHAWALLISSDYPEVRWGLLLLAFLAGCAPAIWWGLRGRSRRESKQDERSYQEDPIPVDVEDVRAPRAKQEEVPRVEPEPEPRRSLLSLLGSPTPRTYTPAPPLPSPPPVSYASPPRHGPSPPSDGASFFQRGHRR